MKTNPHLILAAFALIGTPALALAQTPFGAYAVSPAHPQTWAAGAHLVHQALRWDTEKGVLVADIKYNTADYATSTQPVREDDFTLPFPAVRYDASTHDLIANGVTIGQVRDGWLGKEVVLHPRVALDIKLRHEGKVTAAIIRDYAEDEN